ncbi:MAG: hypothetical protein ABS75_24200 [Pelagibacterium sp. SCN 63-23]|nr:MAG: hypothetical protein ABS75_24200 [Pelagibacterium sp. SCN 63-23]
MADYKELLRRAISALPENNGAARRAVYEKARSALVGQLRAIQPPLPARDITQHRLQLEDCIRQVEQEASEAVISLGRDGPLAPRPAMPAAPVVAPRPPPEPVRAEPEPEPVIPPSPLSVEPEPATEPEPEAATIVAAEEKVSEAPTTASIEDIIAEAAETSGVSVIIDEGTNRPEEPAPALEPAPPREPTPTPARPSFFTPRREAAATSAVAANVAATRIEPNLGNAALAHSPAVEPQIVPVETALSSVREVDLEEDEARKAEGAIERAIETLDREARGEATQPATEHETIASQSPLAGDASPDDSSFAPADSQPRSGAGLTIFLIVFALLLAGVGGAGFWAWREGYVDLDQMFGRAPTTEVATTSDQPSLPTMDIATNEPATNEEGAARPGNTATTSATEPTSALEGVEDRLEPTPDPVTPTGAETVLPSIGSNGEAKTEERLSGADTSISTAANDPAASVDPAVLAGNQSLLLEASADGRSGAVPFSGTVEWSEGVDEIGMPTLVAQASIPARNLGVSITIRKNTDPVLPASHLMEISFDVPDTFIGGSIATLAGVLLKDEELVPGTALAGAAARVVGNSFLFALSASPNDVTSNSSLLESRRWIDLAVVYGTGRNAILTLEKDQDAQVLFDKVLAAWTQ